jgi:hypothetical protein
MSSPRNKLQTVVNSQDIKEPSPTGQNIVSLAALIASNSGTNKCYVRPAVYDRRHFSAHRDHDPCRRAPRQGFSPHPLWLDILAALPFP